MNKTILSTLTLSIFLLISISGCSGNQINLPKHLPHSKPFWVDNPLSHEKVQGKIFGLGSAKEHVRGTRSQRLLAISSAINEIAQQKGVKVDSSLERMTVVSGEKSKSASNMYSKQTVNGSSINATIIEVWKDDAKNELFVLMVSE